MAIEQLPDSIRNELQKDDDEFYGMVQSSDPMNTGQPEKTVDLYTCIQWKGEGVSWWQEINKKEIEGTRGQLEEITSPWLPLRMTSYQASSYGPGYIESACIADLQTAEALSKQCLSVLVRLRVKHLVKLSGVTNAKNLAEAANGAYLPGNPDDVFTVRTDKGSDINVAFTAPEN